MSCPQASHILMLGPAPSSTGEIAAVVAQYVTAWDPSSILRDPDLAGDFAEGSRERIRESYEAEAAMTHLCAIDDDLTSRD